MASCVAESDDISSSSRTAVPDTDVFITGEVSVLLVRVSEPVNETRLASAGVWLIHLELELSYARTSLSATDVIVTSVISSKVSRFVNAVASKLPDASNDNILLARSAADVVISDVVMLLVFDTLNDLSTALLTSWICICRLSKLSSKPSALNGSFSIRSVPCVLVVFLIKNNVSPDAGAVPIVTVPPESPANATV